MFNKRKINKLFKAVDLELNNKNFDKALIFVNNILSLDENNFNALYKKAYIIYLKGSYKEAINTLDLGFTLDAVEVTIEDAISELLKLTGERVTESVTKEVFSKFCVGK